MQVRPVAHAAAFAAALLFAAGASAQSSPSSPNMTGPHPGGTASPAMKAKAENLKQSIKEGTHELHQKVDAEMAKSKKARENGQELTWKSEHEKKANHGQARAHRNEHERSNRSASNESAGGNGMGSASFRRAMAKCTDNENMTARANCAREAVDAHGG